jgi:hypothetical protein
MKGSVVESAPKRSRVLNAVPLQNAVLCAECDVVSDSPHDICMVCGSRSLFNIARVFGGRIPEQRASLIAADSLQISQSDIVLVFPKRHKVRSKATAGLCQRSVLDIDDRETHELEAGVRGGPKGR